MGILSHKPSEAQAAGESAVSSPVDVEYPSAEPPPPNQGLVWTLVLLLLAVFVADLIYPETYQIGILFNICIALTLWSWRPTWVLFVTAASVTLRLIAHAYSPPPPPPAPMDPGADLFNLITDVLVQALTGALIWRQVVVQRRMEAGQRQASLQEWRRRHQVANLLKTEEAARKEAQKAEEQARGRALALARALDDAEQATKQAQKATEQAQAATKRERELLARIRKTVADLERIKNLSVALHRAVLPEAMPRAVAGGRLRLGARYDPAEREMEIGGDFYDFLPLDETDTRFGLVIGDVAGHGVEAAAQTALVTTTLRAYAYELNAGPAEVLSRVARAIDTQLDSFVSLFYGVYDVSTGLFTYASAGHEPPMLLGADQGRLPASLGPTGTILGVGLTDFEEEQVRLAPGDTLVLLTDGVTEVRSLTGQMLGWDGVAALALRRAPTMQDAQSLADEIVEDVRAFAVGGRLIDDIALLVVHVQGEESPPSSPA